jgi:hypothetical protein
LLVTVTALPEAARPAITSAPVGSTRTTSNDGAEAADGDVGPATGAGSLAVDGGKAACCVAVGALVGDGGGALGAEEAAADGWLFSVTLAVGAVDAPAVVAAVPAIGAALVGADALDAPAWAALVPAAAPPAVGVELADCPTVTEFSVVAALPAVVPPLATVDPVAAGVDPPFAAVVDGALVGSLFAEEASAVAAVPVLDPVAAVEAVAAGAELGWFAAPSEGFWVLMPKPRITAAMMIATTANPSHRERFTEPRNRPDNQSPG